MKKGGFLRNVLDTIRSNQSERPAAGPSGSAAGLRADFAGQLKSQHFALSQVARHGFPEQPSALAFDPVQKIAAIGTKSGAIRVFGRPGVDVWAQHKPECAVTHIRFVVNQGAIITVTADESIHLWSLQGPKLKLQFTAGAAGSSEASMHSPPPAASSSSDQPSQPEPVAAASGDDNGAQPGDPDYLLGQERLGAGSPADGTQSVTRQPEILHTLKFQREHITCLHQTLQSKWLYIGTERGNVHVANVETFELSGYSIAWNKAIELSRKTHPGSIIHLSECPQDSNKLLIGYESGCIVLWDLKAKSADGRYYQTENLLWLAWHYEGKQFVAAHGDGSLVTWATRSNARPVQILHPHAKTSGQADGEQMASRLHQQELYRPINKVDWKVTKNNEQFLLFSGGLPYDGLLESPPVPPQQQQHQQQSDSKFLKPTSSSASSSPVFSQPISPSSISPAVASPELGNRAALKTQQSGGKQAKQLRSTSLTVMYGKSITVLEMDETIIDFIAICDSSPYENDTTDPQAVIVLLQNDLILIDLTSPGYPSFDSPYPSAQLNESPVTCVQYLADCSSDLIPFLYSTSQNVISRAPKKGFSDKEWPINGGEWGQSMQSYPELVLTGHQDGSIKFWDMSGVNFDLISKIKTSKLFERASNPLPPNSLVYPASSPVLARLAGQQPARSPFNGSLAANNGGQQRAPPSPLMPSAGSPELEQHTSELRRQLAEGNLFGVDKIEYCAQSRHLLVAGSFGQVIQFKLKKQGSSGHSEQSSLLVEHQNSLARQFKQQLLFKSRQVSGASSGSTGGSSSSSSSHRSRPSCFQVELICLTPMLFQQQQQLEEQNQQAYLCLAPPRVTALVYQSAHSILAYAHENGIVLVDTIQKCIIMNATLNDLYGGASISSLGSSNNRDITIQPFALSSMQQHHYQSGAVVSSTTVGAGNSSNICDSQLPASSSSSINNSSQLDNNNASNDMQADNGLQRSSNNNNDNGSSASPAKGSGEHQPVQTVGGSSLSSGSSSLCSSPAAVAAQTAGSASIPQSRFTTNSMFQRQLSTTALQQSAANPAGKSSTAAKPAPRLFQRQMTASQLFAGSSSSSATSSESLARPAPLGGSPARAFPRRSPLSGDEDQQQQSGAGKKPAKNKRIISRMLSISAIHTSASSAPDSTTTTDLDSTSSGFVTGAGVTATNSIMSADQPDKIDSSFTRSRSSSGSSVANPNELGGQLAANQGESIQCLCFLDWTQAAASNKSLSSIDESASGQLALWLGTSQGCVLLIGLTLPDSEDNRVLQLQSVNAEPIAQASIKLPGSILCLASFVCESSGMASVAPAGGPTAGAPDEQVAHQSPVVTQADSRRQNSAPSAQTSLECKKQARVYQVPAASQPMSQPAVSAAPEAHRVPPLKVTAPPLADSPMARLLHGAAKQSGGNCVARCELSDSSFACRSALVMMRQPEEACLVSFVATGNLLVHSLPRLQVLMDADFVPLSSARIARSMCFSRNGHCLYQPSAGEISKFALAAQYRALVNEMTGILHVQREMPEMPRTNFFRSLFSVTTGGSAASKQSDRDELFGECSAGKAQRGVAKHFASGQPALDRLKSAAAGTMGHDLRLAREGLDERGEKLSEIEDRTLQMMNQAENYSQAAHQLAQKFKDKKWYQF